MTQEVTQWIAEVRSLQRQVVELQQARDQAYASSDNLRRLYEAEAQQRRRDVAIYTEKIKRLQQALAAFQSPPDEGAGRLATEIESIQSNQSVAQLQRQLIATTKQREQLKAMLETEQADHAQTRQSLTTALGDAVDLLTKERLDSEKRIGVPKSP